MRYEASVDRKVSATLLKMSESSHTDSLPLTSQLFFRNAEFEIDAGTFALAAVILSRRYVGEDVVFDHELGGEFVLAMQLACPRLKSVAPVKGLDRAPSVAEIDILCAPAHLQSFQLKAANGIPLMVIDWTGDAVERSRRSSEGFAFGRYFTNAGLIADATTVSIAIGLMHAGMLCRRLIVPRVAEASDTDFAPIAAAVRNVGIALELIDA